MNKLDTEDINKIVGLMTESGLTEFEIEQEGFKLRICRGLGQSLQISPASTVVSPQMHFASEPNEGDARASATSNSQEQATNLQVVKSPMVGTFYAASAPDKPPFVKVGDLVKEDTAVCIIEAMKVMNEITAEKVGKIERILVENGQTVEYGQPLIEIKVD